MFNPFRVNPTLVILLAVSFGAIIGWIDLQASEVQPVVLLLLLSTALLGFAQPPRAWLWALIIGSSILAAHLIGPWVGFNPPYEVKPNVLVTFIALFGRRLCSIKAEASRFGLFWWSER